MTKNLHTHTKLLLILLLCVVLVLVAFACAPKSSTILSSPDGGGGGSSGGGSSSSIDVVGGEKTASSVSEFFSYLKEALAVDDLTDNVAFKFVSEDITVVESGKSFDMYAEFDCKYDRRDDSKTELLFELHSSRTRELVYGLYYLNSTFYMNLPNEKGGVTVYMDEFSLRDILTIAQGLGDTVSGLYDKVMSVNVPVLDKKVETILAPVLKSAVKSVTKTVKGDATQLVLRTDFNAAINTVFSVLRTAKDFLEEYEVDTILTSVFGVSLNTIMNFTFEQFTCDVTLNILNGKLVSVVPSLGYGTETFALDLVIDNKYYGDDTNMVGAITFPEFNDYKKFGVTNMEFTLRVDLENASEKQVTVDNLIGGVLKEYFGLESLGALGERTLTLGKGTIGLLLDVNAELDWNKNERNYLEVEIFERLTSGKKRLGTVYYVGTKNSLYVDFSESNLPKFVYEGLNLASVLKSFVVQTLSSMLGTAEENSAAGEEMRSLVIDTFAPDGTYDEALSNIVQTGTYEVSEAGENGSYAKLDVFPIVMALIKTLEKRPGGRKSVMVTVDRSILLKIVEGLAHNAKEDLDKKVEAQTSDKTLKDINKTITDTNTEITAKTEEYNSIAQSLAQARESGSLDLQDSLEKELETAQKALDQLTQKLALYTELKEAREAELASSTKSARNKFELFASIHDGVNGTLSSADVAIREISVELGILESGFGIFVDLRAKLSEDTYLSVAVDRLSIGYAPTFNVPKENFDASGYATLEEFSAVSASALISLSGDTGSLQSVNLGDALGGMIAELTCLLGVKEPLSGGLDVKVDANVLFDPVSISEYLGGANVKLNLSNIELAVNVYKKPNATTSALTEENRLLTVWYGEYVNGQSAIFVDATGISISEDGTTIPRFMYRIKLEDLFGAAAAAASGASEELPAAASSDLTTEQLIEIVGGMFGGIYIGDEISVLLADRLLATTLGLLIKGSKTDTVLDLDASSKVYFRTENGIEIGARVAFDTSEGALGYTNPYVDLHVSDIAVSLVKREIVPESVYAGAGSVYRDITERSSFYAQFDVDLTYAFSNMNYDFTDLMEALGENFKDTSIGSLFANTALNLTVSENFGGAFHARVSTNLDFSDGAKFTARIELLRDDTLLATLYYEGLYLYVDASGLMNLAGDGGLSGLNIPKFRIRVSTLPCGCTCPDCLNAAKCDGTTCKHGCTCSCHEQVSAAENDSFLGYVGLLDRIDLTDNGIVVSLMRDSLARVMTILNFNGLGDALPHLTPSLRVKLIDGFAIGARIAYDDDNYLDIDIGKLGVRFEKKDLGLVKSEYRDLDFNILEKVSAEISGSLSLTVDEGEAGQDAEVAQVVRALIDNDFGVRVNSRLKWNLSFDLKANVDLSDVDFQDTSTLVNMIPGAEIYFALYNDSNAQTRKLMLMLYFDGATRTVYLTAPWLGVGKVSYSVDLDAILGPVASVAWAEPDAQSPDPLGKVANLILNERGIGVVITGALLSESINLLQLSDDFDLAAILDEINVGIGLNDGLSVNVGAVLKGADLTAGVTGLGFDMTGSLNIKQYVFPEDGSREEYVNVGTGMNINFNSISAGVSATIDLSTSTFTYDATETMQSVVNLFPIGEEITSFVKALSLFLQAEGDVGDALNTPLTVRLDFNLFDSLEFVLTVTNAKGEVVARIMYDGDEDDLFFELPIVGTPKVKVNGTGIMSLIPTVQATANAENAALVCGCVCPACLAAGSCGKSAADLLCSPSCDCTCHLPDLDCGCMNPECKKKGSCFHEENGEQVLNDGCNCSVHTKKSLMEILNEVVDYVALDGSRGVIGVVTKGNALATIAALLSIKVVLPELVLGANVNVRDLGADVGIKAYKEETTVFDLSVAVGDLVIEFKPRTLLTDTDQYRDWKELKIGAALDADVTFVMDGEYAQTLSQFISENVEGDSMKVVVGNNTSQDKVEVALGLEIAANVALNNLVRPDVELWLSFYAKTGDGVLYGKTSSLISLYYNSNEETGGVRQEALYIAGSAYGAENSIKLTDVGLYDVVLNLIKSIRSSNEALSAAGEETASVSAVGGLISGVMRLLVSEEDGVLISADGGALQLALSLINEDLGALFPPTDGVRVELSEDELSVSLLFNENSSLKVEIADAEIFFDKSFAEVDSLKDKIGGTDGITVGASPMSTAGAFRLKGEISVQANTGVTADESGNPVEEFLASTEGGYLGALNFLLKSDAEHNVNYSVSADVSVSGLKMDNLHLTTLDLAAVKDMIGKALTDVKLQATLVVKDRNDKDEHGNDKTVLAVYYEFDEVDTIYLVVPAFNLRLSIQDVLPLEKLIESLIAPRLESAAAAEDEAVSAGGFSPSAIFKLVDSVALSDEKLAIGLSSQILSRVLLMAGIEITLPEVYTTITLGQLSSAADEINSGLGIKVVSALIPKFNAEIRLGDFDVYMEETASDLLAPLTDVFGRLDTYSTMDSLQAKIEFETDLSYGLGENQSNADGNAWAFEGLLGDLGAGIGIIDSLKGHYKLTVSATVNIAEGLDSLYGLEIYIVLYSVSEDSSDNEIYTKQFSVYYGKGILGLNFEPLLGVEPFELELDLGAMIAGGNVTAAEGDDSDEDAAIDIKKVIASLSGVIKIYVKEKSALLNLSGTVLHTALVAIGYDNKFPITAEGVTNLNTPNINALAEGDYTVVITYDDHDVESFTYRHAYRRDLLSVNLTDAEVSAIRYEGQGRSGVFYTQEEWSALFDLNVKAGTITWAKSAEFESLPLGEYSVTVVKTNGKASSSFKMEKKVASYTYKEGLHLTGHAVQQIEIKQGESVLKTLVPTEDQLSGEKELIGSYFAINAYGGLIDLELGDGGIRAKVRLKDDTYLQLKVSDIVIDMMGGTVERKDKNGEVENYTDNIKSLYFDFSVDLAAQAEKGFKLDIDESIGDMLENVLGGLFNGRDINFYAEKAIELNYRLDVQASIKFQDKTIDLAHSELAVTVMDPHDKADPYDDEEIVTIYYVGTQAPHGALYISIPYFDIKLKVDEVDFVKKINEISPFADQEALAAAGEDESKSPTVAETIASLLLGVNLYDAYLDESVAYNDMRFYGIQALFAEQALNTLLKMAGFGQFSLPALVNDSGVKLYIDKQESKFLEAYLEFDTSKMSAISLTVNQPDIQLNKKMTYKNNLGTFSSISEAGSLTLDLSASFTLDSDRDNNIDVSSLVNLLLENAGTDKLTVKTDRSTVVYTFSASLNFSLQGVSESVFGEDDGLSVNGMLKSMLKNLYAHITLDRSEGATDKRVVEAYFYNSCLYLDLSAIGLPKAALPMNLADLVPDDETPAAAAGDTLSCGCGNAACLEHASDPYDPTHPCRDDHGALPTGCTCRYCNPDYDDSFNIYYTARGILAKMETEMFAAALSALGIDASLDVSFNARLHEDEGLAATLVFHGVDEHSDPAHTSVTLAVAKPKIVLGGVIEQMLEDTSDFGYLNNLQNIGVEFTVEVKSLINNTSTAGRYDLDGFIADLFSYGGQRAGLPITLTDDIEGDLILHVAANLDLADVNRSEVLLQVFNRKDGQPDEEWITVFYGGEYDLVVYLPIVDEKFNMTFNVNFAKLIGSDTTDMIKDLPKTISDKIYGALGVESAQAAAQGDPSESLLSVVISVIDSLYFDAAGKIALNCIGTVVERFSEYMLGSTVTLGDMQYLQLYADLFHKNIGIETKIKNGSEAPENVFSLALKDYSFELVKKTIDFDKSQYNTLEDYEFLYVKASGRIDYDLPDGEYDFGGLIKSIADAVEIPVTFEGLAGSLEVVVQMNICVEELKRSELRIDIVWNENYVIQAYMDVFNKEIYISMPWLDVQKFLIRGVDTSFISELFPSATGNEVSEAAASAVDLSNSTAAKYATLLARLIDGVLISNNDTTKGATITINSGFVETLLEEFASSLKLELPIKFETSSITIRKSNIDFALNFKNPYHADPDSSQTGYIKGNLALENCGFENVNIRPEITQNVTAFTPLLDYDEDEPLILENISIKTELFLDAHFLEQQLNMDDIMMYIFGEGFALKSENVDAIFRLEVMGNFNIRRIARSELLVNLYMKSPDPSAPGTYKESLFVRGYYVGLDQAIYIDAPLLGLYGIKATGIDLASLIGGASSGEEEEESLTELSCGCTCETCLENGSCYGLVDGVLTRLCDATCECSHCMTPGCTCRNPVCVAMGSCYDANGLKRCDSDCGCTLLACGCDNEECFLNDIIVGSAASTDSNWAHQYNLNGHYSASADFDVMEAAVNAARKKGIPVHVGNVLSSDVFYNSDKEGWKKWADMNVLAVEMEAFSLYCNAAKLKKKALCLLTVSDSFLIKEELTPEQRQNGLLRMIEIGVEAAEKFAK